MQLHLMTSKMKLYQFISIASEILPKEFDGKAKNLQNFIDCIDVLKKMIVKDYEQIAVLLVKYRLTNYVRNWIGSENSLDQIIETIKSRVSYESSKFVRDLLKYAKQNGKTAEEYCNEIEKLTNRLEFAFIAEKVPSKVAQRLAIEFAVESLTENADNINICKLLKIGNFKTLNDLFEKFITLSTEVDTPGTTLNIICKRYQYKNYATKNYKRNCNTYDKNMNIKCNSNVSILRKEINHVRKRMSNIERITNNQQEIRKNNLPNDEEQILHDPKIIKNIIVNDNIYNMTPDEKLKTNKLKTVIKYEASNLDVEKLQLSSNVEIFEKSPLKDIEEWGHIENIDEVNFNDCNSIQTNVMKEHIKQEAKGKPVDYYVPDHNLMEINNMNSEEQDHVSKTQNGSDYKINESKLEKLRSANVICCLKKTNLLCGGIQLTRTLNNFIVMLLCFIYMIKTHVYENINLFIQEMGFKSSISNESHKARAHFLRRKSSIIPASLILRQLYQKVFQIKMRNILFISIMAIICL